MDYRIRQQAVSFRYCLFLYQKVRKLREDVAETETIKRCVEQAIEPKEQMRGNDILL